MNLTFVLIMVFAVPAAFLATWLFGDLYIKLVLRKHKGNENYPTITEEIQAVSSKVIAYPFMAGLIIGLIAGHLFGQF